MKPPSPRGEKVGGMRGREGGRDDWVWIFPESRISARSGRRQANGRAQRIPASPALPAAPRFALRFESNAGKRSFVFQADRLPKRPMIAPNALTAEEACFRSSLSDHEAPVCGETTNKASPRAGHAVHAAVSKRQ